MNAPTVLPIALSRATPHWMTLRNDVSESQESRDVRKAARGDVDAFERLYRANAEQIHVLARRLVGPVDADDAAQDVFVRVWSKLPLFRGDAQFGTWLHRLAVNVLIRKSALTRRRESRVAALDEQLLQRASADIHARIDIDAALDRLEPAVRQVIVLHDMEGYSHVEIAEILGIGVSAARMRLHRARMTLRAMMDPPAKG